MRNQTSLLKVLFILITLMLNSYAQERVVAHSKERHSAKECHETQYRGGIGSAFYHFGEMVCRFRGVHHSTPLATEVTTNPVIGEQSDFCPTGWLVDQMVADDAIVEEHTDTYGGREDVVIEAGQSRKICKGRDASGCIDWKTFYFRLTEVYCF